MGSKGSQTDCITGEPLPPDVEHHELQDADAISLSKKKHDHGRVDQEVAQYASHGRIEIDKKTDQRLKTMIDRRVLVVMIVTYFMQALDKGTISFVSIMDFQEDTGLVGQQV